MSRPEMNIGNQSWSQGESDGGNMGSHEGASLKVAILGDFSGRASRRLCDPDTIAQRPALPLRKDNFDTVFERLQVGLQLPVMDEPLRLLEFDDLHPDYLYERVPLFRKFIDLEKQLLNPSEFARAAAEIREWKPHLSAREEPATGAGDARSILDSILSGDSYPDRYDWSAEESTAGKIDRLIKDIVAPYVLARPDASQNVYLKSVREAASEVMRKVMHNSDFRQLEASWRSLHLLIRRLEEHPQLDIHLIDVSKAEILADFAQAESDLEQSQLFKCLVAREAVAGNCPYQLVIGDFYITDEERDLHLLIDLATIAEAAGSAVVLGGDSRLAGCPSLAGSLDPDDWHYPLSKSFRESWQAVREYSACKYLALAAPRFMLRLPYGADTAHTESFEFEEMTSDLGHQYYLWGNSAYLLALSFCQQFAATGHVAPVAAGHYTDLPLHLRKLPQGNWLTPCAEALLTDKAAARFSSAGLSTLRSVQGKDEIMLPRLQSLAGTALKGPWG